MSTKRITPMQKLKYNIQEIANRGNLNIVNLTGRVAKTVGEYDSFSSPKKAIEHDTVYLFYPPNSSGYLNSTNNESKPLFGISFNYEGLEEPEIVFSVQRPTENNISYSKIHNLEEAKKVLKAFKNNLFFENNLSNDRIQRIASQSLLGGEVNEKLINDKRNSLRKRIQNTSESLKTDQDNLRLTQSKISDLNQEVDQELSKYDYQEQQDNTQKEIDRLMKKVKKLQNKKAQIQKKEEEKRKEIQKEKGVFILEEEENLWQSNIRERQKSIQKYCDALGYTKEERDRVIKKSNTPH